MFCQESGNNITRSYSYDHLSRPTTTTVTIDSEVYQTTVAYNANTGHQKSITYPNDLVIGSVYNDLGYLTSQKLTFVAAVSFVSVRSAGVLFFRPLKNRDALIGSKISAKGRLSYKGQ